MVVHTVAVGQLGAVGNAKLKRTIRVLINNSRNLQITTTLDKRGRSPNLIQEIGIKANLKSRPSEIKLIFLDYPRIVVSDPLGLD